MMRKLLGRRVIHFTGTCPADCGRSAGAGGLYRDLERNVVEHRPGFPQIRQQGAFTFRRPNPKWFKSFTRYDPRTNGCREGLALKRSKWLVFPNLDVARGPVIEQNIAEDHFKGLGDGDGLAHLRRCAHDRAELEFEIKLTRWAEDGKLSISRFRLAEGSANICPAHDHCRGASVIANRNAEPVRRQRFFLPPEDRPNIRGMMMPGIEIGVAAHLKRQVHLDRRPVPKCGLPQEVVAPKGGIAALNQEFGKLGANVPPMYRSQGHKSVERTT